MSYSDRKEGNWDYQRISGQLKAQEKAQKEAIKAAEKAAKKAAKSSRRSYSAPKNLTVDQVMADYNSWEAKQPMTAEQVMADFNAWNNDADAWNAAQTSTQAPKQTPVTAIQTKKKDQKQEKKEEKEQKMYAQPDRPAPSAITKGGIPELKVMYPSTAYSQVIDYKEAKQKAEKDKASQGERLAKNKAARLEKQLERTEKAKERKDWTYKAPNSLPMLNAPEREPGAYSDLNDTQLSAAIATLDPLRTSRMGYKETMQRRDLGNELSNRNTQRFRENVTQNRGEDSLDYLQRMQNQVNPEDATAMLAQTRRNAQIPDAPAAEELIAKEDFTKADRDTALEILNKYDPNVVRKDKTLNALRERVMSDNAALAFTSGVDAQLMNRYYAADKAVANLTGGNTLAERTAMLDPQSGYTQNRIMAANAANNGDLRSAELLNRAADEAAGKYDFKNATQSAARDNGLAYGAGRIAGAIGENVMLNGLLTDAGLVANTGNKALDFAANQGIKLIPDIVSDTIPELAEAYDEGQRGWDLAATAAKNVAVNELFNLGTDVVAPFVGKKLFGGAKQADSAYVNGLREYQQNVLDPIAKEADDAAAAAQTAAKNMEAVPLEQAAKSTELSPVELARKNAEGVDELVQSSAQARKNLEELAEQAQKQVTGDDVVNAVQDAVNAEAKSNLDPIIEKSKKLEYEGDDTRISSLRTNTAEKSGMLEGHEADFPKEDFRYNTSTEELQHQVAEERYRGSTDLVGDLVKKENYDAADVKAAMDEWGRLLASGTEEDLAKAKRLARKTSYEGRESGRAVQAFEEYSRDPGTSGLNKAQTTINQALDGKYGVGTSEAINNLSSKIDDALMNMDFKDKDSVSAVLTDLLDKELKEYAPNNKALQKNMKSRYIKGKRAILSGVKNGELTSADEIIDVLCKKNHVYNLSGTDQKKVYDFLNEASKYAAGSYDQEALLAEAAKIATKNIPSTFGSKVRSVLYMNMLGNFKTAVSRNFFGNVAYQALEGSRQPVAAVIDRITSKVTGKHTTTGWSLAKWNEYKKGFKKGFAEQLQDVRRHISTGRSGELGWENALKNNKATWGDKGLAKLANDAEYYVTSAMKFGDRPFFEANYAQNLYELESLVNKYGKEGVAGLSGVPDEILDETMDTIAAVRAADSVFQKHGKMSKGLTNIRNGLGEMSEGTLGTDLLSTASTPFTMTPGNMLERAIEYTPLGLAKNAVETGKELARGGFDQRRFVDELSRTVMGVPILAGGVAMANNGLINGGYSADPDEKRAQIDDGFTEYGLNIPEEVPVVGGRTLDTSDLPVIGPFMQAGSAIAENGLTPMSALQAGEAVLGGAATQGLRKVMGADSGSMGYSNKAGVMNNVMNTLGSAGGQLIPSLLRQTAQFTDEYKRDLGEYGTKDYFLNGMKNSVPFLRETLPIKYDTEGNPVLQNQGRGVVDKALESYLLPMNVSEYEQSKLNEEALRLKQDTSTHTAMGFAPRANRGDLRSEFEKDEVNGEYSEDIYREYAMDLGTRNSELGNALIDSDWYNSLDDDDKAKALSEVYSIAKHVAIKNATGQEITDKKARIYNDGGVELLLDYMKTSDDAKYTTENGTTTSSTYSKVNALSDLSDESLEELLPEFLELTKDNGEPNYKGQIYDKYGARTLLDFFQNGYEVTGREELPKTKAEATEAALMFPKSMQEDMLNYYLNQQTFTMHSKTSKAEQEVLDTQGVAGLQQYVEQEDTLKKYGSYSYDEKAQKIYQQGGIPALEQYGQTRQALEKAGVKGGSAYDSYVHAKSVDPSITPKKFAGQYKYIDSLGNSDGSISQKEIIAAMNARPNDAQAIEALYWTSDSYVPVLKNGTWTRKKVKKKK